ncbi:MAG: hypothetical protein N4A35_10795 [Flavobacteriales bacterium]|nr:hypothetical protein [Flavobacteriales bacterium]
MKKLFFTLAIASFFISCEGENKEKVDQKEEKVDQKDTQEPAIDLSELREFEMNDYDLEATIFIPENHFMISEEEEGLEDPVVTHSDGEAKWDLTMRSNKNWSITIEDWGDEEKSVGLEKEIHKETSEVYDYKYIEEGTDYLLFQRALKSGSTTMDEKTASKLPNYHFVVVKNVNGTYITIKSNDLGEFRKISAQKMLNAARAIK